jgi:hypothetical protein
MQKSDWWYSSSASGTKNPAGNMTWAEADRSWMKAKGRSVRTVLDSVDLTKTRQRRRRKVVAAAFFAAASLGLAALFAFAVRAGPGDGQALANIDESHEDAPDTGDGAGLSFAVAGQAATEGSRPAGLKASVTANGGPGRANLTGGVDVANPTDPTGTLPPPMVTSGGGGNGGSDSPVDVSVTLGDPLGGGSLLNAGGVVEGVLSITGEVSGQDAGSLIPAGTLLDINVTGNPENTDDPVDAGADVNAGETDASVNGDDLLGDLLGRLLQLS